MKIRAVFAAFLAGLASSCLAIYVETFEGGLKLRGETVGSPTATYRRIITVAFAVGSLLSLPSAGLCQEYSVVRMTGFPGVFDGTSLSENGTVSGVAEISPGDYRASTWQNGVITRFDGYPGQWTDAEASNLSGTVVGQTFQAAGAGHAARWQGGTFTDLGCLAGTEFRSAAFAVNEEGWIAGGTDIPQMVGGFHLSHPFVFHDGVMHDIGDASGLGYGGALDINGSRQITGYFADSESNNYRAFIWSESGGMHLLTNDWMTAYRINDNGQIVGLTLTDIPSRTAGGYVWQNGSITMLGAHKLSYSFNNHGDIVGVWDAIGGGAVLWRDGNMYLLETLVNQNGWGLDRAIDINDSEQGACTCL